MIAPVKGVEEDKALQNRHIREGPPAEKAPASGADRHRFRAARRTK